ncbi:MAG: hypothetical protein HN704_14590 [Bacteroidetes bacterium]|jgi:hypothetical protein|nr:hypothetical protein [Bacteroidota bacterium]MBT6686949.1 hypothetical protein [Bacteroidota bacterium]MBT7143197.1 hypothetical protein [Bacteroidota bacterium]MBT7492825.1 hypothetical protein [Bacteroidota bacterium]
MKKAIGVLTVLTLSLAIVFTSCKKEGDLFDGSTENIMLKSLEPDVKVKGSGNIKDYKKVIVQELIKSANCKDEIVSGIVKFYYKNEMVFSVDFGDGKCDGLATVSWLDENNSLQTKVVDVWKLFKDYNGKKCFEMVYPVSYTMPDSTTQIVFENDDDWDEIKTWYANNPGFEKAEIILNFPVEIKYEDGTIFTIVSYEEMLIAKKKCYDK